MHVLDEIFAERYEEQNAEEASEHGAQEHLPEIHLKTEDVDRRQGEYRSGHHDPGACSYALDNHVLAETALLAQGAGHAHGYDRYGYRGLEHLSDLEPEIGRGCRKQDGHQQSDGHGIGRDLKRFLLRFQEGPVNFLLLQFPVGVLRQA